jgi:Glycosyl hydrolase family 59
MSRWKIRSKSVTLTIVSGLVVASGSLGLTAADSASAADSSSAARATAAAIPTTTINVNGDGGDKTYQGTGAILGGGGNARYLMDYPAPQRNQLLDYLFKPGYGASLQILKLEIGGGTNSTDGAEPSIEPTPGNINCNAGYEFSIAQAAVQRNPNLVLYGLQWTAPAWVTGTDAGTPTLFTQKDINYLIDWLNCAKSLGLTVGYLGGWNENAGGEFDTSTGYQWYVKLRNALNANGFGNVKIIAGDINPRWEFASTASPNPFPEINVLGAHDFCKFQGLFNEQLQNGAAPPCTAPTDNSGKPRWASEIGRMDAGAQNGCAQPCAPAMDRSLVRAYQQAQIVGYLEWPAIDSMPVIGNPEDSTPLPYENRGLLTADQPWSGNYTVNAMTWAIAQLTDFTSAPTSLSRWLYQDTGTGYLPMACTTNNNTHDCGAYVTLLHQTRATTSDPWQGVGYTTVVESTTADANQTVKFDVTGGAGVSGGDASLPVHVWSSNFDFSSQFDEPQFWLWHRGDTTASDLQSSGYTIQPGFVYTFTTATTNASSSTSQAPGSASASPPPPTPPASAPFTLPYSDDLSSAGAAGSLDDEPQYLAAQDGSFEIVKCTPLPAGSFLPPGSYTKCTGQTTQRFTDTSTSPPAIDPPVFWKPASSGVRFPYANIGDGSWQNYTENVYLLLPPSSAGPTSGGLLGYYSERSDSDNPGLFNGYVFDLSSTGAWKLVGNTTTLNGETVIDSGTFTNWPANHSATSWNKVTLSFSNGPACASPQPATDHKVTITAAIDGTTVSSETVCSLTSAGLGGLEAGYTSSNVASNENWPAVQYSDLSVTSP